MSLSGVSINKLRIKNKTLSTPKNLFLKKIIQDDKSYDLKSVSKHNQTNNRVLLIGVIDIVECVDSFCEEYFGQAGKKFTCESLENFNLAEEIILSKVDLCIPHFLPGKEVEDYLNSISS